VEVSSNRLKEKKNCKIDYCNSIILCPNQIQFISKKLVIGGIVTRISSIEFAIFFFLIVSGGRNKNFLDIYI